MKQILLIDLENPSETKYICKKEIDHYVDNVIVPGRHSVIVLDTEDFFSIEKLTFGGCKEIFKANLLRVLSDRRPYRVVLHSVVPIMAKSTKGAEKFVKSNLQEIVNSTEFLDNLTIESAWESFSPEDWGDFKPFN